MCHPFLAGGPAPYLSLRPPPQLPYVTEVQLTNEGISSVLSTNIFVISSQEMNWSYMIELKFWIIRIVKLGLPWGYNTV